MLLPSTSRASSFLLVQTCYHSHPKIETKCVYTVNTLDVYYIYISIHLLGDPKMNKSHTPNYRVSMEAFCIRLWQNCDDDFPSFFPMCRRIGWKLSRRLVHHGLAPHFLALRRQTLSGASCESACLGRQLFPPGTGGSGHFLESQSVRLQQRCRMLSISRPRSVLSYIF